jgi:hypothetical protein
VISAFISIITTDGTVLVRDPATGAVASGRTLTDAVAALRRLATIKGNAPHPRLPSRGTCEAVA